MPATHEQVAAWIVAALYAYAIVGALFAVAFVTFGMHRIDHEARGSAWTFRLMVVPGVIALWPALARRWAAGGTEPPLQKDPHR